MDKVRVPIVVKDPEVSADQGIQATETYTVEGEDVHLDGPVDSRVAVLDFDPDSGALRPGVPYVAPAEGRRIGGYGVSGEAPIGDPGFPAVSTYGLVRKTLDLFEDPDVLGREIPWAFGAPQLLVVPCAGEWANAFYERDSHSLQFFQFHAGAGGALVRMCLSSDIVAHETTHAILDGVAPDLYEASTPQSLALHEAIADLGALQIGIRSSPLRDAVLRRTIPSGVHPLERSSVFSGMAEQFASAAKPGGHFLRDLKNDRRLQDLHGEDRTEPHALSEVLSGALYGVLVRLYDLLEKPAEDVPATPVQAAMAEEYAADPMKAVAAAHRQLVLAAEVLKRAAFRGLDYLPPGEVTFADYARAIVACDQAAYGDDEPWHAWLRDEFVERGIVEREEDLVTPTEFPELEQALADADVAALGTSDWAAYRFVERNRRLLGIPPRTPFDVRPRLRVTKRYWTGRRESTEMSELILKVSWTVVERCRVRGLPKKRRVHAGTTLVLRAPAPEGTAARRREPFVRALLLTENAAAQGAERDALIRSLVARDLLRLDDDARGPDGRWLPGVVPAETGGGVLRMRRVARLLHVAQEV